MEKERTAVGEGLRQVLWGELLAVVSLAAALVGCGLQVTPLVWLGNLVGVVSMIMVIVGLASLAIVRGAYKKALLCVAVELVLSIASVVSPNAGKAVLVVLTALCASAAVRLLCESTCEAVLELGGETQSVLWGGLVWKVYAVGSILSALVSAVFLYHTWAPGGTRLPAMLASPILQIAVLLVYLFFLDRSQHALREK